MVMRKKFLLETFQFKKMQYNIAQNYFNHQKNKLFKNWTQMLFHCCLISLSIQETISLCGEIISNILFC